jgi:hypothetical protein
MAAAAAAAAANRMNHGSAEVWVSMTCAEA